VVTLGGKVVRVTPNAVFTAPGSSVELLGLYYADAGQHLEHRLFVDHAVPNCKSRVTYKGALQGQKAHTIWVGDVLIRKAAEGTDTYELNRNLLLTDGARCYLDILLADGIDDVCRGQPTRSGFIRINPDPHCIITTAEDLILAELLLKGITPADYV
jgi:hypothetical protein